MSDEQDARIKRIKDAIEVLGRDDPKKVTVRRVQELARVNMNLANDQVGIWKEEQKAGAHGKRKSSAPRSSAKPKAEASPPKTRNVPDAEGNPGDAASSNELADLRSQMEELKAMLRAALEPRQPVGPAAERPNDAPSATPSDRQSTLADQDEIFEVPLVPTNESLDSVTAIVPAASAVSPVPATVMPVTNGSIALLVDAAVVEGAGERPATDEPFSRATVEVIGIVEKLGMAPAIALFNALPDELKVAISPRRAQELLRAAAAREPLVRPLENGRWFWAGRPMEVPRKRARSDEYFAIRAAFADFSVSLMESEGRPFADVELFDRYARKRADDPTFDPGFVREYTSGILDTCKDCRLVKMQGGGRWLAGRDLPAMHCGEGYHSRLRNEAYGDVGRFTAETLKRAGHPMSGTEIRALLPPELEARLPSHDIQQILRMATRDVPELFRGEDRLWWVHGLPISTARPPSVAQRLATETIEILTGTGATSARKVRRMLSEDLQRRYSSILQPLRQLRDRYPQIVVGDDGICSLASAETPNAVPTLSAR